MSLLVAAPEMLTGAARTLAGIGSAIGAANAAGAAPTTGVLAAAADEVSAAVAAMLSEHGLAYQALSAQAAAFHTQLCRTSVMPPAHTRPPRWLMPRDWCWG